MRNFFKSNIFSTGLAIFSMFFGAGNLMYPISVGLMSGDKNFFGITGFLVTGVCLPLAGLIAMILFNGNYKAFFYRLGAIPGKFLIFASMLIIGPAIAIPRIVTLSHTMLAPFLPMSLGIITPTTSFLFALIFLGVTFLCTYRENKIVDLLGYVISPALLFSLLIIIAKGFMGEHVAATTSQSPLTLLKEGLLIGYGTLDVLAAIFFASIILNLLKRSMINQDEENILRRLAVTGFQAGIIGVSCLALIYVGLSYLGVFYGFGLETVNSGELFREVSRRVLGDNGAIVIAIAVLMACLSTAIALSVVTADYLQNEIFRNRINYVTALLISICASIPLSTAGIDYVLGIAGGPLVFIGSPIIITLIFCNIAFKLFDFKPVKIPVLLAFVAALFSYWW